MRLVLIGLVSGFLSALFGVGGGIVVVPLLILLCRFGPHVATATSLAGIVITALAGAITYAFHGEIDLGYAALVGVPAGVRRHRRDDAAAPPPCEGAHVPVRAVPRRRRDLAARMTLALALLLGFAAGVVAGMFGVGGGILFVPTLIALGLGQVEAEATSLAAIIPTVAGTWRQHQYGNVRWRAAIVIGVVSILGVQGAPWPHWRCPKTSCGGSSPP